MCTCVWKQCVKQPIYHDFIFVETNQILYIQRNGFTTSYWQTCSQSSLYTWLIRSCLNSFSLRFRIKSTTFTVRGCHWSVWGSWLVYGCVFSRVLHLSPHLSPSSLSPIGDHSTAFKMCTSLCTFGAAELLVYINDSYLFHFSCF